MAPMEFISMDLIGDFYPSTKGNKYALTVICNVNGLYFLYTNTLKESNRSSNSLYR